MAARHRCWLNPEVAVVEELIYDDPAGHQCATRVTLCVKQRWRAGMWLEMCCVAWCCVRRGCATWLLTVTPAGHQCVHTVSELKQRGGVGLRLHTSRVAWLHAWPGCATWLRLMSLLQVTSVSKLKLRGGLGLRLHTSHVWLGQSPGVDVQHGCQRFIVAPAGHQCVHTVSALKQGAIISDFELLTSNIQDMYMDLQRDTYSMTR